MICLDNSVLSRFASPTAYPRVTQYLSDHADVPWTIPATVAYEYYSFFDDDHEVRRQQRRLAERFDAILPLTDAVAAEAIWIENALDEHDVSLSTADCLHVATAHEAGATFVTRDAADFDRAPVRDLLAVDVIESV